MLKYGRYTNLETFASVRELKDSQVQSTGRISTQVTSMESSLQLFMSQTAASFNLMGQRIDTMVITSRATQDRLAAVDANIAVAVQNQQRPLINAAPSDDYSSTLSLDLPASSALNAEASQSSADSTLLVVNGATECIIPLVDTTLVLRVRHGLFASPVTYNLEPGEDVAFTASSIARKKEMVGELLCLRLILWLLRKENYMMIASCEDQDSSSSENEDEDSSSREDRESRQRGLVREAALHSIAAFSSSYSALDLALGHHSLQLALALPWLRWKPWLQYLFDRVEDRAEDGKQIMSMVVRQ